MDAQLGSEAVWYAALRSDSHETDAKKIETDLDAVLSAVGIPPENWVDFVTARRGMTYPYNGEPLERSQARMSVAALSLGGYLVQSLYGELPIEYAQDGESDVFLQLTVDGKDIEFVGYGDFWTEYHFPGVAADDPRTEEELFDDDEESDSDVGYEFKIQVQA